MDCSYWKDVVARLRDGDDWAAHVLGTNVDEYWNLAAAQKCVSGEEIVKAAIFGFQNPDSQPYCDEILAQFDKDLVLQVYSSVPSPNDNIVRWMDRFFDL